MKVLWAPWRMKYIESKSESCIFCDAINASDDKASLLLHRGKRAIIIMNKFPYANGHLMVAPNRHIKEIKELNKDEWQEVFGLLVLSTDLLSKEFHPQGFNIGANIGFVAGAGYEHLHFHIVPRWNGDTNYMPVLAETKVIPQHLERTYSLLKKGLGKFA